MYPALGIAYRGVHTLDDGEYPILVYHYDGFAGLVDEVRAGGGGEGGEGGNPGVVLVHCLGGVNRSAILCVAYLVERCGVDLVTACRWVRGSNGSDYILENVGFRLQLVEFCTARCPAALQFSPSHGEGTHPSS